MQSFVPAMVSVTVSLGAKPAQAEGERLIVHRLDNVALLHTCFLFTSDLSDSLDHSPNAFALDQGLPENRVAFDMFASPLRFVWETEGSSTCLCIELAKCTLHACSHNQPLLSSVSLCRFVPSIHLDSRYMGVSVEMYITSAIFCAFRPPGPGFFSVSPILVS